jgi:uncharacterized protein GlcG (DUF336 family)
MLSSEGLVCGSVSARADQSRPWGSLSLARQRSAIALQLRWWSNDAAKIPREETMIRTCALAAGASVAAFAALNAWAADPLPTESHKVLTVDAALEAAQGAIAHCKAQGYNVTVTVADRLGNPKVVIVRDGPPGVGQESTRRKAYTSAKQRVSTLEFTNRISRPGAFNPAMFDRELATGAGGVPIKAGEETIGGIAAAGAPGGDKDEACAQAGVDKIKDRLR